jgi:hypothetical protein
MHDKNNRRGKIGTRPGESMILGRRQFLVETGRGLLLLGLSPLLSRCGNSGTGGDGPFTFAVISDTHVVSEEQALQNKVFSQTVEILNAFTPKLDFVVATGDIVDCLPSDDPDYYDQNYTGLHRLLDLASGFRMPLHLTLGNHDYYTGGGPFQNLTEFKQQREQLFMDRTGMPGPYYSFVHRGVKFCFLNSLQQEPSLSWKSNIVGCIGPEQAAWFVDELRDGKPAFFFHHHPLATDVMTGTGYSMLFPFDTPRADAHFSKYQGTPYQDYTDPIYGVLDSHADQIRAGFFGHAHIFLRDEYQGIPIFMTNSMQFPASTSYEGNPMRFHIVECRAGTGDFTIYNAYMIRYQDQTGISKGWLGGFTEAENPRY